MARRGSNPPRLLSISTVPPGILDLILPIVTGKQIGQQLGPHSLHCPFDFPVIAPVIRVVSGVCLARVSLHEANEFAVPAVLLPLLAHDSDGGLTLPSSITKCSLPCDGEIGSIANRSTAFRFLLVNASQRRDANEWLPASDAGDDFEAAADDST